MRRLFLLAYLSVILCPAAWSQQDLEGGVGEFIEPPKNPPARKLSQRASASQRRRPPGKPRAEPRGEAGDEGTDGSGAATTADLVEDALWLGNEARDSMPPRYEEAKRAYRLAAKLAPKDPRPHIGLGNIFWDQKRLDLAAASYRVAVEVAGLYNARVKAEVRSREREALVVERATGFRRRRSIKRSIARPSEEVRYLYASAAMLGQESAYFGAALIRQGKYHEAEAALKEATRKNSENAEWWALLGAAQLSRRKYVSARRSLRLALSIEPENERYAALLSRASRSRARRGSNR